MFLESLNLSVLDNQSVLFMPRQRSKTPSKEVKEYWKTQQADQRWRNRMSREISPFLLDLFIVVENTIEEKFPTEYNDFQSKLSQEHQEFIALKLSESQQVVATKVSE